MNKVEMQESEISLNHRVGGHEGLNPRGVILLEDNSRRVEFDIRLEVYKYDKNGLSINICVKDGISAELRLFKTKYISTIKVKLEDTSNLPKKEDLFVSKLFKTYFQKRR